MTTRQNIESLKSKGQYAEAGAMAYVLDVRGDDARAMDRGYGCHYGMRSDRAASIAAFVEGFDDAARAARLRAADIAKFTLIAAGRPDLPIYAQLDIPADIAEDIDAANWVVGSGLQDATGRREIFRMRRAECVAAMGEKPAVRYSDWSLTFDVRGNGQLARTPNKGGMAQGVRFGIYAVAKAESTGKQYRLNIYENRDGSIDVVVYGNGRTIPENQLRGLRNVAASVYQNTFWAEPDHGWIGARTKDETPHARFAGLVPTGRVIETDSAFGLEWVEPAPAMPFYLNPVTGDDVQDPEPAPAAPVDYGQDLTREMPIESAPVTLEDIEEAFPGAMAAEAAAAAPVALSATIPVSNEAVFWAIVGALEGGSNCWLHSAKFLEGRRHETPNLVWYGELSVFEVAYAFEVGFDDPNEPEGEGNGRKVIRPADVSAGLQVMATKYGDHFADLLSESNADATTYDVFMQCVVLGDVVYG